MITAATVGAPGVTGSLVDERVVAVVAVERIEVRLGRDGRAKRAQHRRRSDDFAGGAERFADLAAELRRLLVARAPRDAPPRREAERDDVLARDRVQRA